LHQYRLLHLHRRHQKHLSLEDMRLYLRPPDIPVVLGSDNHIQTRLLQ
jgi:hypothetical protein